MDMTFDPLEARIIGCLLEKEVTTPEQYPLSLNALVNACNQKSSREPVMDVDELTLQQTLDGLIKKHLVSEKTGFGSRVVKYKHRFCNTEFGNLKLTDQEVGVICLLLLRGPQTPGELRSRAARLCHFDDVAAVETVLQSLATRSEGPLVKMLPRLPGKRESRYMHLFSGHDVPDMAVAREGVVDDDAMRMERLEFEVRELRQELDDLKSKLKDLLG